MGIAKPTSPGRLSHALRSCGRFNIFDWLHDHVIFICLLNLVFSIDSFPRFFRPQGIFFFLLFLFLT